TLRHPNAFLYSSRFNSDCRSVFCPRTEPGLDRFSTGQESGVCATGRGRNKRKCGGDLADRADCGKGKQSQTRDQSLQDSCQTPPKGQAGSRRCLSLCSTAGTDSTIHSSS